MPGQDLLQPEFGSDLVVNLLRAFGVEYAAMNPGATFRGIHDSLVNYAGNQQPELILCCHEEIAVSLAHGYAKAAGKPMAAVVHDIVGLQHASMAIFNAFCDRAPILVLGGTGPMDTARRRPWIDWIHTALVQGNLVRDYVKWDDQPASAAAVPEAFARAYRIAMTEPKGPIYLCFDADLQEGRLDRPIPLPDPTRFAPASPPQADSRVLAEAARLLCEAEFPVILVESLVPHPWARAALQRLAELLAAPVIDLGDEHRGRSCFPNTHPLELSGAKREMIREADVILALDVQDFLGTLGEVDRTTREVKPVSDRPVKIIGISLNDYAIRSWAQTYLSLVPLDLPITADAGVVLPPLVKLVEGRLQKDSRATTRQARLAQLQVRHETLRKEWLETVETQRSQRPIAYSMLAASVWEAIKDEDWILANGTARGWAKRVWEWQPERFFGGSGGAGLGYGLGASLGVALALRDAGKVCVNLQPDGDFLYVTSALYTAAHHQLPLLTIMCNNRSYYNDEEHQEVMAKARGRSVENKVVGIRIEDPAPDFAKIAQGFGVYAEGPIEEPNKLGPALKRALKVVKEDRLPALVDVVTQRT
ncbi:MAG TPA: thiamine pyrophosphate-binding protein [Candidatus Binatia bacterium]|nr:thiamine pyrophosphate-binding protein [Candidatus Binatia bacterium]